MNLEMCEFKRYGIFFSFLAEFLIGRPGGVVYVQKDISIWNVPLTVVI